MSSQQYWFGKWIPDNFELDNIQANVICDTAHKQIIEMSQYPVDRVIHLLGAVAKLWSDPSSHFRTEALQELPKRTGFSKEMVQLALNELTDMLCPSNLALRLEIELKNIPRSPRYQYVASSNLILQYQSLGTVFHVLSGNVFLVGPSSLIQGLLTGNVNILKMPSSETYFLPQFVKSIIECDRDGVVKKSIALVQYTSDNLEAINTFKNCVDGIVIWGSENAIQVYRSQLPARTRTILFGPKISFALIFEDALTHKNIRQLAQDLAMDLALWDQNACTAPQICFVQGDKIAKSFLEELHIAMSQIEIQLPSGFPSVDTASEIRKLRSLYEINTARSLGDLKDSGQSSLKWTLLYDTIPSIEPSPLHRTLRIIPFKDIEDIKSIIAPIQGYIQTIGLACNENLYLQYSQVLLQQGTCRITQIGSMGRGSVGEPHDGAYDFPQFLRLTSIGWKPPRKSLTPYDCMDAESKEYIINSNFKKLISSAKRSQFYSKILKEIELNTIHDLPKIPILTRDVWEKEMAEWNTLETKKSEGGYLTRSGGTTGTPKYSMTDGHDWEAMVNHAVTMFNACGFYAEDRIANFMAAGDLYGSFISFNHVNYKLGAMSFAYASNYNTESFLEHWRKFKINSIQGFPTQLAILFHECLKLDIHFKIEKIMYAGLPMSETDKTWFREKCGVKIISSVIGTTETNQIGYQCEHLKGNEHHLTDDYNYVEIVGENGNVIPTEEVGRIVVTNLQKHNFPIIRYSIGDSGRILQKKCNCGKADRVFEYLGRWDDQVSMGMMNLSYQDTLVALQAFPISSLQIQISYYKQKDLFELLVETSDNYSEDLKLNITKELTLKLRGFKYHLEKEDFIFNLKLLPIGTILRNERTGKVKSILDLRQDKTSN